MTSTEEYPYVTGDKDQYLVKTPYGKGLVVRTRPRSQQDGDANLPPVKEVRLLEWERAAAATPASATGAANRQSIPYPRRSRPTTLYTTTELEPIEAKKGDDVMTIYGRGRVIETITVRIRKKKKKTSEDLEKQQLEQANRDDEKEEDKKEDDTSPPTKLPAAYESERVLTKYRVQLTSWRLANRSTVTCHLFSTPSHPIQPVRAKTLGEMSAYERVAFAQRQKSSASTLFSQKQYQRALNVYAGAVDAVRYVQHDTNSSNELRADLIEVLVTCSNNAATCCVKLERWVEAERFAQNALVILDALFRKRGMKIHVILVAGEGLCDAKVFGEWRVKSHLVISRAFAERGCHVEALETLKKAREIVAFYLGETKTLNDGDSGDVNVRASASRLMVQEREIVKLMAKSIEMKKKALKKEKARAQAMFGAAAGGEKVNGSNSDQQQSADPNDENDCDTDEVLSLKEVDTSSTKEAARTNTNVNTNTKINVKAKDSNPKPTIKKRVSFAEQLEERRILHDGDDGDNNEDELEEEPWYEEHKEALLLLAAGGLAAFSVLMLRRK